MPIDVACILRETFVASVEHHRSLGSTNDRAAQCASESVDLPRLIVADRQTAGRGRGTNRWWTPTGSLAMSLLLEADRLGAERQASPLVTLATALAVVDTVAPRLPGHQVGIHWPNDVHVGDRKLAGILIEVLPDRRHIVGIGINTNNTLADAPAELRSKACTIRDLAGAEEDPTRTLVRLLKSLEHRFGQFLSDPESIVQQANSICLQRHCRVIIQNSGEAVSGRCQGIGPEGAILLETPQGPRRFVSGIVRVEKPCPPIDCDAGWRSRPPD